jgi:hypothetical protein
MKTESSDPTVSTCRRCAPIARHQRLRGLWVVALLAVAASLTWLPAAQGKGLESVTACGADGCREIQGVSRAARVGFDLLQPVFEGVPTDPPAVASEWFRIEFGWLHMAEGEDAIDEVVVPASLDRIGFRQRGQAEWVEPTESAGAGYVRVLESAEPFPAESFPSGFGVTAAPTVGSEEAADVPWLHLGVGAVVVVSVGGFLLARRPGRPPPEPA